jgi:hypothetical protein
MSRNALYKKRVAKVRLARYVAGRSSVIATIPARLTQRSRKLWLFQLKKPTLRSELISNSDPSTRQYVTPRTRSASPPLILEECSGISLVI